MIWRNPEGYSCVGTWTWGIRKPSRRRAQSPCVFKFPFDLCFCYLIINLECFPEMITMIPNQINHPNTEIEIMIYTGIRTNDFSRSVYPTISGDNTYGKSSLWYPAKASGRLVEGFGDWGNRTTIDSEGFGRLRDWDFRLIEEPDWPVAVEDLSSSSEKDHKPRLIRTGNKTEDLLPNSSDQCPAQECLPDSFKSSSADLRTMLPDNFQKFGGLIMKLPTVPVCKT